MEGALDQANPGRDSTCCCLIDAQTNHSLCGGFARSVDAVAPNLLISTADTTDGHSYAELGSRSTPGLPSMRSTAWK